MYAFKNIFRSLSLLLALCLGACSDNGHDAESDAAPLGLEIKTRGLVGSTVEGVTISSLRLIAVRLNADYVVFNKTTLNGGLSDQGGATNVGSFLASLKPGHYQIHAIANETSAMTTLLQNVVDTDDIRAVTVQGPYTEPNLVMYASKRIEIRPLGNNIAQTTAEVKEDGESVWKSALPLTLERMAVKISLGIKKITTNPADQFRVKKVEVVQLPQNSYLMPKNYTGALANVATIYNNATGMLFSTNAAPSDPVTQVGSGVIVPEYLLGVQDPEFAAIIQISATYNNVDVLYRIPVRRNLSVADYSLYRDCHYMVNLTITKAGDVDYNPYVEYSVGGWTDATGEEINVGGTITFSGTWAAGTTIVNTKTVAVYNNGYVEYQFVLINPSGATWFASLSNGLDFAFDYSDSAVSSGNARPGHTYTIRIKPLRTVSVSGVQTQFYITVISGSTPVEIDLLNGAPGSNNRLVVTQIPY